MFLSRAMVYHLVVPALAGLAALLGVTVAHAANPATNSRPGAAPAVPTDSPSTTAAHSRKPGPVTTDAEAIAALDLSAPGLEGVKAAVEAHDLAAVKERYLEYRRTASPVKWWAMPADQPKEAVAQSDEAGEEICRHFIRNRFYRLGPKSCDMGKDFNWTANPVPRSSPDYSDEWTWCTISRTQFWETLADAYWKTRQEKYAREWVAELLDFAAKNRADAKLEPGEPSLWRTLDGSGRVGGSWPYAYYHFLNSPAFTPEAHWTYLKLVMDHVPVLKKGLDVPWRTGNWVAAECGGLYAIGALFPELRQAAFWRDFAVNRLTQELDRMVPPDGMEAELTPMYHYGSARSFAGPMKLANLNHLPIPEAFHTKLLAMYRAPILMMDQTGGLVCVNDSDPMNAGKMAREGLAMLGEDALLRWAASGGKEGVAPPVSTMLPYAGFYAMRGGWKRDDTFVFFRGGPPGIGHQHEDMLEIVLRAWNKTLLFDPGSYSYDSSDWRRYILGTASHNTIMVDGKWQHRGANRPPVTQPVQNPWVTSPLFDYVSATYAAGYQQNEWNPKEQYMPFKWVGEVDHSVSHTRRVLFLRPGCVLVLDTLDGTGSHTFDAHFHLDAPSARLERAADGSEAVFSATAPKEPAAQLALYPLDRTNLVTQIVQGQQNPLLGWFPDEHRAIPTVRFRKQQEAPALFATLLYPYRGQEPQLRFQAMKANDSGLWTQSVQTPQEQAEIILAKDNTAHDFTVESPQLGAVQARAAALVVRRSTGASGAAAPWVGGWELTSCRCGQWELAWSAPARVVWQAQDGKIVACNAGSEECDVMVARPFQLKTNLPPGVWVALFRDGAVRLNTPPKMLEPSSEPAQK